MKRILITFFCILLLAVLFACADETMESSNDGSSQSVCDLSVMEFSGVISDESANVSSDDASESSDISPESNVSLTESSEETNEETSDDESEETSDETTVSSEDETSDETSDESSKEEEPVYTDIGDAELLPSGYLIYDGAAYMAAGYSYSNCERYAQVYDRYALMFPDTRITVINPPLSIISVKNPLVRAMMNNQEKLLDNMQSHIYGRVNFVNLKDSFVSHRGEYMYFKSDYHWTQLGAYYAYVEYAKSVGISPTPLGSFERRLITDSFIGRSVDYAMDERVTTFTDIIHAYMPRKSHTMTIYQPNGDYRTYSNCIVDSVKSYSCFIKGDNPVTVINVPSNDQNKSVVVIKESSGNAFVPFLTEHYGKIFVIDPRHIDFDMRSFVEEKGIDEIIFFSMASTANGSAYCNYYENMIGG